MLEKSIIILGVICLVAGSIMIAAHGSDRALTSAEMEQVTAGANNKQCKAGGACGETACSNSGIPNGGCPNDSNNNAVACYYKVTAGTYPYCQSETGRDCIDNPNIVCGRTKYFKTVGGNPASSCSFQPYAEGDGGKVCGC